MRSKGRVVSVITVMEVASGSVARGSISPSALPNLSNCSQKKSISSTPVRAFNTDNASTADASTAVAADKPSLLSSKKFLNKFLEEQEKEGYFNEVLRAFKTNIPSIDYLLYGYSTTLKVILSKSEMTDLMKGLTEKESAIYKGLFEESPSINGQPDYYHLVSQEVYGYRAQSWNYLNSEVNCIINTTRPSLDLDNSLEIPEIDVGYNDIHPVPFSTDLSGSEISIQNMSNDTVLLFVPKQCACYIEGAKGYDIGVILRFIGPDALLRCFLSGFKLFVLDRMSQLNIRTEEPLLGNQQLKLLMKCFIRLMFRDYYKNRYNHSRKVMFERCTELSLSPNNALTMLAVAFMMPKPKNLNGNVAEYYSTFIPSYISLGKKLYSEEPLIWKHGNCIPSAKLKETVANVANKLFSLREDTHIPTGFNVRRGWSTKVDPKSLHSRTPRLTKTRIKNKVNDLGEKIIESCGTFIYPKTRMFPKKSKQWTNQVAAELVYTSLKPLVAGTGSSSSLGEDIFNELETLVEQWFAKVLLNSFQYKEELPTSIVDMVDELAATAATNALTATNADTAKTTVTKAVIKAATNVTAKVTNSRAQATAEATAEATGTKGTIITAQATGTKGTIINAWATGTEAKATVKATANAAALTITPTTTKATDRKSVV